MKRQIFLAHIPLRKGDVVSLVGSGGKTTIMYQLARELTAKRMRVITTTTTKIFPPLSSESSRLVIADREGSLLTTAQELFKKEHHLTLAEKFIGSKLKGISPHLIDIMKEQKIADVIVNEADGARGCPLKAPNETEPVIPSSTTWTLAVVGLDGIGKINTEDYVFRPDYFSRLTGVNVGEVITPEAVSRIILHPEGITRETPAKADIAVILNKGEISNGLDIGKNLASLIMKEKKKAIVKVLITSLAPLPKVLAIFNP
ncbi:MAG TPA: selenium cofactor biosynthesis protein YqeC [Thermodesulfobacteriota bacterium]|nr:selenium cofactor biosynthesis protein YqeC [Thermodesulfobacteriota bacterium]